MITPNQVREYMLALPETVEKAHFGKPDFRVNNKIFGGLSADGKRANLKLPLDVQISAIALAPQVFTPCAGAWGRSGWTDVELIAVDPAMFKNLVSEAWRTVAPQRLIGSSAVKTETVAAKTVGKVAKSGNAGRSRRRS